jgi:CRISPR-associated protein Cmr5
MATRQMLEQKRARYAWERVGDVKGGGFAREYRALARSAGADIQTNGLGQTLAFWRSKPDSHAHSKLYEHVSNWLCERVDETWVGADLLEKLIEENTSGDQYRRAAAEALALLVWLKRFAEAEIAD